MGDREKLGVFLKYIIGLLLILHLGIFTLGCDGYQSQSHGSLQDLASEGESAGSQQAQDSQTPPVQVDPEPSESEKDVAVRVPPPVPGAWELTLEDEFDGDSLNEEVWTKNLVWDGGLGGSAFHRDNVFVQDGKLIIETTNKNTTTGNGKTYNYTSGLIHTMGKFTQKFGYFEVKMTLPTAYGPGFWPAFWLYPDRYVERGLENLWSGSRRTTYNKKGKGMEIDIMEHLSIWGNSKSHYAIHWDEYGSDHKNLGGTAKLTKNADSPTKVFGLYWSETELVFFVDGVQVRRVTGADIKAKYPGEISNRIADVPMFMKLNVATGGWNNNRIGSETTLPAYTTVDWVRVWKRK